jgi:predicted MFS family arabinose efflux permease
MNSRLRTMWSDPAGRGFLMLAAMSICYGFAYSAQNNIVTNFFEDVLHFSGPEFGYITAVREVGGLLLIILMMALYRVSLQALTAGAMVVLGIAYALFGVANDFLSVVPWVLITSFGFHTVLQTQYSLGMSLTTQEKSGHVLGRMAGFYQGGTFAALIAIFFIFRYNLLSYEGTFILLGVVAVLGGFAIFRFPHLHEGQERKVAPKRERVVWRNDYKYYYALNLLDGVRQQVFFSFGLWVLVNRFGLTVSQISLVLMLVTFVGIIASSRVGRSIDRLGERRIIQAINIGYVVALGGYALAGHVALACVFYVIYAFISPFSSIAASTYLRKIAVPEDIAPSLAMGVTLLHATAIVVPVVAGYILNYVGYQVPFFIACGAAMVTVLLTLKLDTRAQRSPARVALDEARLAAQATGGSTAGDGFRASAGRPVADTEMTEFLAYEATIGGEGASLSAEAGLASQTDLTLDAEQRPGQETDRPSA